MDDFEVSDNWTEEEEDFDEPGRDRDEITECPNCKKPITPDLDSCPFCGDILFRYLRDGTFSPRKGPLVKVIAVLIVVMVLLVILGLLLRQIGFL
ncbi:MAG: hypothetical protein JW860_05240 [Sedimentisphaerales bacterium]|nr:hypothetical protein [Sedimentisphaerales bacterium]